MFYSVKLVRKSPKHSVNSVSSSHNTQLIYKTIFKTLNSLLSDQVHKSDNPTLLSRTLIHLFSLTLLLVVDHFRSFIVEVSYFELLNRFG